MLFESFKAGFGEVECEKKMQEEEWFRGERWSYMWKLRVEDDVKKAKKEDR